jgi:hypothetical protein
MYMVTWNTFATTALNKQLCKVCPLVVIMDYHFAI